MKGNFMKKNIILIMTDQQRLDYTSYGGFTNLHTPNIDRIAGSVGFTNCQTTNPICTPARTSLITGKYTRQIGTLDMSGDLSLQFPTFMKALQRAGYYTCGIGKFHFLQTWKWDTERGHGSNLYELKDEIKKYGYDYVWEASGKQLSTWNYCDYCKYMDDMGLLDEYRAFIESEGGNTQTAEENPGFEKPWPFEEKDYVDILTADRVIDRITDRDTEKPFYIFSSFCSPHKPYDPPKRYLDMIPYEEVDDFILPEGMTLSDKAKKHIYSQRRSAKAMVKLIDDQVGRILDALEEQSILNETVLMFTCDHGDMLGDHGRLQKQTYWKQSSTVPAAIFHPEYKNEFINSTPVSLMDFAATILDIAGLDYNKELSRDWPTFNDIVPCKSLLPIIKGEKVRIRDYTFTECKNIWQMIQTDNYKYVKHLGYKEPENIIEELYDLLKDPDELVNVADDEENSDILNWCRQRLMYVLDNSPPAQTTWAHTK